MSHITKDIRTPALLIIYLFSSFPQVKSSPRTQPSCSFMLFTLHRHFEPEEVQFHPSTSHISGAALLVFCVLEWYYNGCMNRACPKPQSDSDIHKSCEFLFRFLAKVKCAHLGRAKQERGQALCCSLWDAYSSLLKRLMVSRRLPCRKSPQTRDYDCPLSQYVNLCRPLSSHVKMSCLSHDVSIAALLSLYYKLIKIEMYV